MIENKKISNIPIKLMKLSLILIAILVILIAIVSSNDIKREITKKYVVYTKEGVEPKWDTPEWAKERCNNHYIVARCSIDLFWEIDYSLITSRSINYRDYNGNYLAEYCGPQQSSKCDFYDSSCDNLENIEDKIICNKKHW